MIAPAPTRDLLAMLKPSDAKKVDNAKQYVHEAPPMANPLKPGLNAQPLFNRTNSAAAQGRCGAGRRAGGDQEEPSGRARPAVGFAFGCAALAAVLGCS